jgi:hypothetical protein
LANVEHSDITDPEIHEPKGASAAGADTVYIADGAGSGAWSGVTGDALDATAATKIQAWIDDDTITVPKTVWISAVIDDISTASTVLVPIPAACTVVGARTALGGAITVADATVTFKDHTGATMGTITVAFTSSAAGDEDSVTMSANNELAAATFIQISTDGGSTDAQKLYVTIEITLS